MDPKNIDDIKLIADELEWLAVKISDHQKQLNVN